MKLQFMPFTDLSRVCIELKITFTIYLILGTLYVFFPFYENFDTLLCVFFLAVKTQNSSNVL